MKKNKKVNKAYKELKKHFKVIDVVEAKDHTSVWFDISSLESNYEKVRVVLDPDNNVIDITMFSHPGPVLFGAF